ncbi:substrate-binding domain-containing protein [Streptomyces sp. NPDC099050]|uniref:substrate-binding domain-containing protein n=1 Tax=Streptomyces sp. NPDC099050 TaxID=3366100 RepID=UPI00380F6967
MPHSESMVPVRGFGLSVRAGGLSSARHTSPPLTTVHQPVRALGQEMARMLVSAIEGHRPSPLILPTRLTVRESAPDLPASA